MRSYKVLKWGLVVLGVATASATNAGPQVNIVFKNNGAADAVYDVVGSSAYSYAEASPKPSSTLRAGGTNQFAVRGRQSADVTTAVFQYRMGSKICKFKTSYLKLPSFRGTVPKWNKSAEASGGARCDVRITSTNVNTHDWTAEFIMR